jgi:hypothetical protein
MAAAVRRWGATGERPITLLSVSARGAVGQRDTRADLVVVSKGTESGRWQLTSVRSMRRGRRRVWTPVGAHRSVTSLGVATRTVAELSENEATVDSARSGDNGDYAVRQLDKGAVAR